MAEPRTISVAEAEALVGKVGGVVTDKGHRWPHRMKITGFVPYPPDPSRVLHLTAEDVTLNADESAVVSDVGADGQTRRIAPTLPWEWFGDVVDLA